MNAPTSNYIVQLGLTRLLTFCKDFRNISSRLANIKFHRLIYYLNNISIESCLQLSRRYITLASLFFYPLINGSALRAEIETSFDKLQITGSSTSSPSISSSTITKETIRNNKEELRDITFDIFRDVVNLQNHEANQDTKILHEQQYFDIVLDCLEIEL